MTPTQRDEWHKGRNAQLLSDKAASRYSWVDQALENQTNTHWAYGTIGLPVWLTTNERTLNSIFQIRLNAAREIMEVAREHLRRETASYQAEADRILDAVNEDLQPTQAKTSRRLVEQHATRHMTAFTEDLSERREWLINHQPTMIETISMRPEGTRPTPAGKIPAELLSEDDSVEPSKSVGLDSKESNPTVGRKRKTRPKKRSRLAAQARSKVEPPAPKTTPPSDKGTGQRSSDPKRPSTSAQDPPTSRPRASSRDNVAPRPRDHRGPRVTGNQGRDHPRRSPPSRRSRSPRRHEGRSDYKSDDHSRGHGPPRQHGRYRSRSPRACCHHEDYHSHASPSRSSQDDSRARGHTNGRSHFRDGQRDNRDTRGSGQGYQSRHTNTSRDRN